MQLGVRAHDFGKRQPAELAADIAARGFSCIQLAPEKSFDGSITPGMAASVRDVFRGYHIEIAVLGCYIDPVHPDETVRSQNLKKFKQYLGLARDFGCSIVGTETGSGEAFDVFIESLSGLAAEAEKQGVFIGIEGVTKHVVSTPEKMQRVFDTIKSDRLKVIFDPVNFISIKNYREQEQLIEKSFALFGEKIAVIHVKDFVIKDDKVVVVEAGQGMLNYAYLFKTAKVCKQDIYLLMENVKMATLDASVRYIKSFLFPGTGDPQPAVQAKRKH